MSQLEDAVLLAQVREIAAVTPVEMFDQAYNDDFDYIGELTRDVYIALRDWCKARRAQAHSKHVLPAVVEHIDYYGYYWTFYGDGRITVSLDRIVHCKPLDFSP